jgi:hypothetical protein
MDTKYRIKYYCQCGCGEEVTIYRGKPMKFKQGHALRTKKLKQMHSKRMKGNTLFLGGKCLNQQKGK